VAGQIRKISDDERDMVPLMRTLQSGRSALDAGRAAELFPTAGQRHNERVDNMQGHHKPKPKAWVNYGDAAWRKTMADVRDQCGRMGMRDSDHYGMEFQPIPLSEWSKRELKNRIAWLQKQRGQLIAKKENLVENNRKLAKYTDELFRRESTASHAKEREEHNAKRRRKRATAKRKQMKALADKWVEERKAHRKLLKKW
jgi:hypothetical protein